MPINFKYTPITTLRNSKEAGRIQKYKRPQRGRLCSIYYLALCRERRENLFSYRIVSPPPPLTILIVIKRFLPRYKIFKFFWRKMCLCICFCPSNRLAMCFILWYSISKHQFSLCKLMKHYNILIHLRRTIINPDT